MRKWGNEEMRKWEENTLHFTQQFCFCSHQGKVNVHACTHWEINFAWQLAPKGYAMALHHSVHANSVYKFFTFESLLAISWNLLNLWIFHTLFQLYTRSHFEASSWSCLHYGYTHIYIYIYNFVSHNIIKTAWLYYSKLVYPYSTEVHKMPVAVILQWIHTLAL